MIVIQPDPAFVFPSGRYALVLNGMGYDFTVAGPIKSPEQCLEQVEAVNGTIVSECPPNRKSPNAALPSRTGWPSTGNSNLPGSPKLALSPRVDIDQRDSDPSVRRIRRRDKYHAFQGTTEITAGTRSALEAGAGSTGAAPRPLYGSSGSGQIDSFLRYWAGVPPARQNSTAVPRRQEGFVAHRPCRLWKYSL